LVEKHFSIFEVQIERPADTPLGLRVTCSDTQQMTITSVSSKTFALRNSQQLTSKFHSVHPGDVIVSVNGASGITSKLIAAVESRPGHAQKLTLRFRRGPRSLRLGDFRVTEPSRCSTMECLPEDQLQMALSHLGCYQRQRRIGVATQVCGDARSRFLEFLKSWLRLYADEGSPSAPEQEVQLMIVLCGDILRFPHVFPRRNACGFLDTIAHVQCCLLGHREGHCVDGLQLAAIQRQKRPLDIADEVTTASETASGDSDVESPRSPSQALFAEAVVEIPFSPMPELTSMDPLGNMEI